MSAVLGEKENKKRTTKARKILCTSAYEIHQELTNKTNAQKSRETTNPLPLQEKKK